MKDIARELLDLEEEIAQISDRVNRLKGQKDLLIAQLKEKGFKTIQQAEKYLEKSKREIEKEKQQLEGMIEEIRQKFPELF